MPTKRRKITRPPRRTFSAKAIALFQRMKVLDQQCQCTSEHDECKACAEWWDRQGELHRELGLRPWQWPCIQRPDVPNTGESQNQAWYEQAQQLYRAIESQAKGQAS
jgi:hypothetical protein